MRRLLSIFGLCLLLTGCITTGDSSQSRLAVIETWSGHAAGRGGDCSDADVLVRVLEDFTIVGTARATEYNMVVQLKGALDQDRHLVASGSGIGGVFVTYRGNIEGETAAGTWESDRGGCGGTWKLSKLTP